MTTNASKGQGGPRESLGAFAPRTMSAETEARDRKAAVTRDEAVRAAILAECKRHWPDELPCAEIYRWAPWAKPEYRIGHRRAYDATMFCEGYGGSWDEAIEHVRSRGVAFLRLNWPKGSGSGDSVQP